MKTDKEQKPRKAGGWKKAILIIVITLLSLVLIAVVGVVLWVNSVLNQIERVDTFQETMSQEELESILGETDPMDPDFTGPVLAPEDVTVPGSAAESIEENENDTINILLVGQDWYYKDRQKRSRSDAMILCTINKSTKTVTFTSFMRDMYVRIPGYYNQRINVAYAVGGFEALYDTLEYNFGVHVDGGVAVNYESFRYLVNAVGGLDLELTAAEARYLNNLYKGKEAYKYYNWSLTEGVNHMDGMQVLCYSQIRALDSDFGRTNRQRIVLNKLVEKAKTLPLTDLYSLVGVMVPMVITDMSNSEIMSIAVEAAPLLQDITVVSQRIPADGEYRSAMVGGMSVLLPDLEGNRQFLLDTIGTAKQDESDNNE